MASARRRYDSPRRREQADATRLQILRAAQQLFERDGYTATSVAAIAAASGVSVKTIYLAFESKSGVLRALWHLLLRGDEGSAPVAERLWFRQVLDEPDPAQQLRLNARNSLSVKTRAGAVLAVIRDAASADTEIGTLWARIQTEFHDNQRAIVESLDEKAALRADLDLSTGTDVLWALNHPSLYWLLVGDRGWTLERYQRWLAEAMCSQLLAAGVARESG